jgi:hypothetical protein
LYTEIAKSEPASKAMIPPAQIPLQEHDSLTGHRLQTPNVSYFFPGFRLDVYPIGLNRQKSGNMIANPLLVRA